MMRKIRINERGQRIGEGHHMARLTDSEVDALISDRGPDGDPRMSYSELATKYGISKSSVRDILIGRRRGQVGPSVSKPEPKRPAVRKVRVNLKISLHARAKLHRLGGGVWLQKMVEEAKL